MAGGERLQSILDRGKLICGVHGTFQGFGYVDSAGNWTGFDVEFCRAWAAALFNDANAVEFRGLSAQERFTALQSGEGDALSRNSTWTYTRDAELGLTFGPVTFYDGQAIMARKDIVSDPAAGLDALSGANVCVQSGTTPELNLADQFRAAGVKYTPVVFEDQNVAFQAYDEGRCDAITSDRSQLATQGQAVLQNFDDHIILDLVMSKEPLAPVRPHVVGHVLARWQPGRDRGRSGRPDLGWADASPAVHAAPQAPRSIRPSTPPMAPGSSPSRRRRSRSGTRRRERSSATSPLRPTDRRGRTSTARRSRLPGST